MRLDISIVDDEIAIAELVRDLLEQEGYRVGWAPTAFDGLRQVVEWRPRLVICDVMLPGMNGVALLARLGELGLDPPPRCILMSAAPIPEDAPRHVPFIRKPFEVEDLLELVEAELARADARQQREARQPWQTHFSSLEVYRGAHGAAAI